MYRAGEHPGRADAVGMVSPERPGEGGISAGDEGGEGGGCLPVGATVLGSSSGGFSGSHLGLCTQMQKESASCLQPGRAPRNHRNPQTFQRGTSKFPVADGRSASWRKPSFSQRLPKAASSSHHELSGRCGGDVTGTRGGRHTAVTTAWRPSGKVTKPGRTVSSDCAMWPGSQASRALWEESPPRCQLPSQGCVGRWGVRAMSTATTLQALE